MVLLRQHGNGAIVEKDGAQRSTVATRQCCQLACVAAACGVLCAAWLQVGLLQSGRGSEVVQETRLWDEGKQATTSMRTKEGLADYRCG